MFPFPDMPSVMRAATDIHSLTLVATSVSEWMGYNEGSRRVFPRRLRGPHETRVSRNQCTPPFSDFLERANDSLDCIVTTKAGHWVVE